MKKWLFLVLAWAGCSSPGQDGAQKKPVWEDLPAYSTLVYVDGLAHRNPEFRSGWQEYRGPGRIEEVAAFYRNTLPVHGWALASEEGKDPAKLTFTKKSERCVAEIATADDLKLSVRVTIGYKD